MDFNIAAIVSWLHSAKPLFTALWYILVTSVDGFFRRPKFEFSRNVAGRYNMTKTMDKYMLWSHVSRNKCSCHYHEWHHLLLLHFCLLVDFMTNWLRSHCSMTIANICCYLDNPEHSCFEAWAILFSPKCQVIQLYK